MNEFLTELKNFRRKWQMWQMRCLLLQYAGWFVLVVAVLCWIDLIFSLSAFARMVLNIGGLVAFFTIFGIHAVRIMKLRNVDSAVHADTLLRSRRREILSALEMGRSYTHGSEISQYLVAAEVESAHNRLRTLTDIRPSTQLGRLRRNLVLCLVAALVPVLFTPRAGRTLISRMLFPYADIPPYSAYVFTILPENPGVIYGSDQVIQVAISGKPVSQPVRFVTRQGGHILESACFQAAPDKYLQRIEQVMQPVSFCFRVGKARSQWHHLTVLYQPQVQSAQITLIPPAYTRKPEKNYTLGTEPLKALKGTQVELTVQSNRPLKAGNLTITPIDGISHARTIEGKISGPHAISWRWELMKSARLSAMIYDILGTAAREPLRIDQNLVPDAPPVAALSEPAVFVLATPETKVPIYGFAEDDIGIRRVDLYRALKGYRSRPIRIQADPGGDGNTIEVKQTLNLAELGVTPGQVIELFLEASDTNPALTGVGASDITRIKIISRDDYAQMIRSKTTVDAFRARFSVLSEKFNELLKTMKQTEADLKKGGLTSEQADKQINALRSKMQDTAADLQEIAEDFSAFDLEKKLAETAQELVDKIDYALGYEGWSSSDPAERQEAVSKSLDLMKNQTESVSRLRKDMEEVAAVSRVMEMAAKYNALVDRQEILVSRLGQHIADNRKFPDPEVPAEQQDAIRKDLDTFISDLTKWANALPEEYEALRSASLEFVTTLRQLDIPEPMNACSRSCRNEQPREAWRNAVQALEKMKQARNQCRGGAFGSMCSGNMQCRIPNHLSQTLSQMLESLMQQHRSGSSNGNGTSTGGMAGNWEGSYLSGFSTFDTPVYGPRSALSPAAGTAGSGDKNGPGTGVGEEARYAEVMKSSNAQQTQGNGFFMKAVPPRYQDAVRNFYGKELNP